jgi:hypothetical protein
MERLGKTSATWTYYPMLLPSNRVNIVPLVLPECLRQKPLDPHASEHLLLLPEPRFVWILNEGNLVSSEKEGIPPLQHQHPQ